MVFWSVPSSAAISPLWFVTVTNVPASLLPVMPSPNPNGLLWSCALKDGVGKDGVVPPPPPELPPELSSSPPPHAASATTIAIIEMFLSRFFIVVVICFAIVYISILVLQR